MDALGELLMALDESHSNDAEEKALSVETDIRLAEAIACALSTLEVRERYIVERRLMAAPDDQLHLAEIARRFSVSLERARQIEARATSKLQSALGRWLAAHWAN